MARYWTTIHLVGPVGKRFVDQCRADFVAHGVAQLRAFNPKPETARVRYVAPSLDGFREGCPMVSWKERCPSAHICVSVEGRPFRKVMADVP